MLKTLSYQKKVKLLLWLVALVLLLVYWLAVSETIKLRRETKLLETEAAAIERAPMEMANLKQKLEEINKTAGDNKTGSGMDPLMELTSKLTSLHQVTLSEYQPAHLYPFQNYTIETRITSFEAPFIPCLKVLNDLETSYHHGKIVSVNFLSRTDHRTLKKHLTMQILIQSIQNEKNTLSEKNDAK